MPKKLNLLIATSALALSAIPMSAAMAAAPVGFAGTVGASYGQVDCDGCGEDSDSWSIGGSGAFGVAPNIGAQVDLGYSSIEETDLFGIGGSVFWAPAMGRLGGTLSWQTSSEDDVGFDVDLDAFTYGVFGEYYLGRALTLGAKGGGININVDGGGFEDDTNGAYIGGALTGYILPNLAIQGDVLFTSAEDFFGSGEDLDNTAFTIGAEFLVSEMVPVSIFGSYTFGNVEIAGSDVDTNRWLIGARFYFGAAGPTLIDKHRNGTLGWIGSTSATSIISP